MTIESAKKQIVALLEKRGFEQQKMKPDLFILKSDSSKVGVDLFGEKPIAGVFISGMLEEAGHGVQTVFALREQILAIWEKETKKEKLHEKEAKEGKAPE